MNSSDNKLNSTAEEFVQHASMKRNSVLSECFYLVKTNKKWWMLPLIMLLLALGTLIILSGTGAAPFIYTLF